MGLLDLDGRVHPHLAALPDDARGRRRRTPLEHLQAVLLAEHAPVDEVVAVPGHQLGMALDAGETLDVVDLSLGPHDVVGGGDHLTATAARTRRPEHLDVVVLAEDHSSLGEAGRAYVRELGPAAGALQTRVVPVAVQGVQQEPVHDPRSATRAAPAVAAVARREMLLLLLRLLLLLHHGRVVVVRVHHTLLPHHDLVHGRGVHAARVVAGGAAVRPRGEVGGLRGGRRGVPLPADGDPVGCG